MLKIAPALLILTSCILFFSCKKKKDEQRPLIEFLYPDTYATYFVFDEVITRVKVSDNKKLEWVNFSIIDSDNRKIVSDVFKTGFSTLREEVEAVLPLSDIHIESGTYNIRVEVSDGENEHVIFKEITIIEESLKLERILLCGNFGAQSKIDSLGMDGVVYPGTVISADFGGAVTNSYDQELVLIGDETPSIHFIEAINLNETSSVGFPSNGTTTFFHDIYYHKEDRKYYISFADGRIEVFNKNGSLNHTFQTNSGMRPYKIFVHQNYIYVEERNYSQTQKMLSVYHKNSGVFFQSRNIDFDLVGMHFVNNELILLGNNNVGKFARYFVQTNGMNVSDYEFDLINDSQFIEEYILSNRILIATDSKVGFIDTTSPYFWSFQEWDVGAKSVVLDKASLTIFAIDDNELHVIPLFSEMQTYGLGDSYENVLLVYNK